MQLLYSNKMVYSLLAHKYFNILAFDQHLSHCCFWRFRALKFWGLSHTTMVTVSLRSFCEFHFCFDCYLLFLEILLESSRCYIMVIYLGRLIGKSLDLTCFFVGCWQSSLKSSCACLVCASHSWVEVWNVLPFISWLMIDSICYSLILNTNFHTLSSCSFLFFFFSFCLLPLLIAFADIHLTVNIYLSCTY